MFSGGSSFFSAEWFPGAGWTLLFDRSFIGEHLGRFWFGPLYIKLFRTFTYRCLHDYNFHFSEISAQECKC